MQLGYIEQLGRFSLWVNRFLGWALAIPAMLMAALFFLDAGSQGAAYRHAVGSDVVIAMICLAFAALGVRIYLRGRDGKRHPAYRLLRDRPHDVARFTRVTALGTGRDRFTFFTANGETAGELLVPTSWGPETVVVLKADLPHARFGTP